MKQIFIMVSVCFLLAACGNNTKAGKSTDTDSTTVVDMHNAENSLDYEGTYKGTIPAADCPGIEATLTLNSDKTFQLHYSYLERDSSFDQKGTYSLEGYIVTLKEEGGQSSYYKIGENKLTMLMTDKQEVTGEIAKYYILEKVK